jgi:mannose/fructose/N-acetylgalactosamine-specific phosphotransferase system component IIB
LGGTKKTDSTKSLSAAVNVTEQDEKELKRLSDLGVKVYIQQVPTSPSKVLFE